MRILHVIPSVAPGFGGPTYAVKVMSRIASEHGHQVAVVTTNSERAPSDTDGSQETHASYRYFERSLGSFNFAPKLFRHLQHEVCNYDLLHVHGVFAFPCLAACIAARRRRVPYILRTLGQMDPWSLAQKRWKKLPYYWLLERQNLRAARRVHATSELEAKNLIDVDPELRVATVANCVALPPPSERFLRSGEEPLQLLFLSRVHPKKGIEYLLNAVANLNRERPLVQLTIAGNGSETYIAQLRQLAEKLGISGAVAFFGFADANDKARLFKDAHAFVLPSFQENFAIAVAEAMAHGLPAIVSDQVAIAENIGDSGAGSIVRAGDAEQLAASIAQFLDPQRQLEASTHARQLVEQRYSVEAVTPALLNLYETALAG